MTNVFTPKSAKKFSCKECDFECSKGSDRSRHIFTQKHKIRTNTNDFTPKNAKQYHCNCGKKYKHASSLWNHKKNCENENFYSELIKFICKKYFLTGKKLISFLPNYSLYLLKIEYPY